MQEQLLHVPVSGREKAKVIGIARGKEKFAFLYGSTAAVTATCVITYSLIARLVWWQSLLLLIVCLFGVWMIVFSFLEVYRATRNAKNTASEALDADTDPYASRTVTVGPPTGEPYPHHEDYAESPGLDQGQLTSQLPDWTPFMGRFPNLRRDKKQKARS